MSIILKSATSDHISGLREKTGRKPGAQKGRKGNTLKMVEIPDHIEEHIPSYCGLDIPEQADPHKQESLIDLYIRFER